MSKKIYTVYGVVVVSLLIFCETISAQSYLEYETAKTIGEKSFIINIDSTIFFDGKDTYAVKLWIDNRLYLQTLIEFDLGVGISIVMKMEVLGGKSLWGDYRERVEAGSYTLHKATVNSVSFNFKTRKKPEKIFVNYGLHVLNFLKTAVVFDISDYKIMPFPDKETEDVNH